MPSLVRCLKNGTLRTFWWFSLFLTFDMPYCLQRDLMCLGLFSFSELLVLLWASASWFCLPLGQGAVSWCDPCTVPSTRCVSRSQGGGVCSDLLFSRLTGGWEGPARGPREPRSSLYLCPHRASGRRVPDLDFCTVGINGGRISGWNVHGDKLLKTGHSCYFVSSFSN